jgi:hypothetical protein
VNFFLISSLYNPDVRSGFALTRFDLKTPCKVPHSYRLDKFQSLGCVIPTSYYPTSIIHQDIWGIWDPHIWDSHAWVSHPVS